MRVLIQRVTRSSVSVDGRIVGEIGKGLNILACVMEGDTAKEAELLAAKCAKMRIFEDDDGKMNRCLLDVDGEALVISQFTLYGNCKKGRRPEFLNAARPEIAIPLYEKFIALCREKGYHVETGEFGAYMQVESLNDGPFTLVVDTENL